MAGLERRMAQTMQQIIIAAATLFVKDGYDATSMDAIALAAGISRKTLFNYVDSKPALITMVIRHHLSEPVTTPLKENAELSTGEIEDFFPRFDRTLKAMAECRVLMRLGVEYANLFSSDDNDPVIDLEPNRTARIARTKLLQSIGKIRADIPAEDIVRHFEILRNAVFRRWLKSNNSSIEWLEREIDQIKAIITNGIKVI
ncbi:TetR/AcrR family transcriptional regulator [Sphingobium sp. LB126]|uniref:TetR/AcrR family transcriptional regulator n=1 Tax=Sphingobium sp. LB126 TaxID=1983755 RepID=UPI0012FD36A6|nr:TetR/AcrR family transcriptional regulator [Sphingobium sp. LB126]